MRSQLHSKLFSDPLTPEGLALRSARLLAGPEGATPPQQGDRIRSGSRPPPLHLTLPTSQAMPGLQADGPRMPPPPARPRRPDLTPSTGHRRVSHILNMAREIDNFYPERFIYHNVRLWDEESAQLLPHWKETHRFVEAARWGSPGLPRLPPAQLQVVPSALNSPGRQGLTARPALPLYPLCPPPQDAGHPGARPLQDGSQPLGRHCGRLRHEAVRLEPGAGPAPRAGAPAHRSPEPWLSAPAADLPGHPDCQVRGGDGGEGERE